MELSNTIIALYNSRKLESDSDYDLYDEALELLHDNPEFVSSNITNIFKCLDDTVGNDEYVESIIQLLESVNIITYTKGLKKALVDRDSEAEDIFEILISRLLNDEKSFIVLKEVFINGEIEEKKVLSTVLTNIKKDDTTTLQEVNGNMHLEKMYNSEGTKHKISKIDELLSIL